MKTTDKMLEATKELWKSYNEHPFVKGIQDGSLDKDKFKYVLFKAFLFGTPNDIFDTPNIVFTPNFSFTILMHFKVSNASSC